MIIALNTAVARAIVIVLLLSSCAMHDGVAYKEKTTTTIRACLACLEIDAGSTDIEYKQGAKLEPKKEKLDETGTE